jgi:hypothetical protein
MEQAVIARELMRGNGFSTTVIKPAAITFVDTKKKKTGERAPFDEFLDPDGPTRRQHPDYFHAPLNRLVNALALKVAYEGNKKLSGRPTRPEIRNFGGSKQRNMCRPQIT